MNTFSRTAARRIALVSALLACVTSPLSYWIEKESAEEDTVALAIEESGRLLHRFDAVELTGPRAVANAELAAQSISGGLFDIAEIYDTQGTKLAESLTREGQAVEESLPKHGRPAYQAASYESVTLPNGLWVLQVFVPLHHAGGGAPGSITGYFEGVRVVPDWQRQQIVRGALVTALMVGLASLLCGLVLYPVVVSLAKDNERKTLEVLDSHISMMEALGRAIAKRDSDTGAHNYRVAWIAARIGEQMGLQGQSMQALIAGSFLHDVGKIGVPDAILLKPARLNEEEMRTMRGHVTQGEEIVKGMGWLDGAHEVVAGHHEKWDGSGYPRGLAGPGIPLSARIFAVADVFDALCSKRPYKEPMGFDAAMQILERDTGQHFDPSVMRVFRRMAPDLHAALEGTDESQARALLEERVRHHFGWGSTPA
jgi:HD-GYP domain-containing protein (c-di-GMP phosphodiesterase class II)